MRHSSIVLAASLAVTGFAFNSNIFAAPKEAPKAAATDAEAREKHDLKKMPKVVQESLLTESKGGTDIDYYRVGGEKVFGVSFKDAKGEPTDIRVDRQGKVLSRLTGAAAVASAAPGTAVAAAQPAPATPAPAAPSTAANPATPAQPAPTAAPAAVGEFDTKKGDVQYDQLPAPVKASLADSIKGGKEIRFYKAKEGATPVYDARFVSAAGKDMSVRVDEAGKIVSSKEVVEGAQTAASKETSGTAGETNASGYTHIGDIPGASQAAARKLVEGGREPRFFKTGTTGYDVKWIAADGVDHSAHVDAAGKVSDQKTIDLTPQKSTQDVGFWDLPDDVRTTARKETKDGKNAKYSRALVNGARIWKIRYETADKKEMELRVDDVGKVLSSHEVTDRDTDKETAKPKTSTPAKDTSKK